jgi:hypothetical protein
VTVDGDELKLVSAEPSSPVPTSNVLVDEPR